jgi:hypothetical protein
MVRRPLTAFLLVALAGRAHAQRAEAEAEFERGHQLMEAGRTAEACAAFEASMKLDPQRGTLYNLGLCHEKLGKLASAWAELDELSQTDTNDARRKDAARRAAALAPRLPKMHLTIAKGEGVVVTRDNVDVTSLADKTTPIDPGKYTFEAKAPGKRHFISDIKFEEGKSTDVEVPELEADESKPVVDPEAYPIELPLRPILIPHHMVEATGFGEILVHPMVYDRTGIDAGVSGRTRLGPFELSLLTSFHVRSAFVMNKPGAWHTVGLAVRYPLDPSLVVGISYVEVQPSDDDRGPVVAADIEKKLLLFPKVAVDGRGQIRGEQRGDRGAFVIHGDGNVQFSVYRGLSVEGGTALDLNLAGSLYNYTVGLTVFAFALYAITPQIDAFAQVATTILPDTDFQTYIVGGSWRSR